MMMGEGEMGDGDGICDFEGVGVGDGGYGDVRMGEGLREQVLEYVQLDLKFLLGLDVFKALLGRCPEFGYLLLCREVEEREGV
jgi:hypothetical protein